MELDEKLRFLHEMIRTCYPVSFWVYDQDGFLLEMDCPRQEHRALLEKSGEFQLMLQYDGSAPYLFGGMLGILWGAVAGEADGEKRIYLIGPVLYAELTDSQIDEAAKRMVSRPSQREAFAALFRSLPVIPLPTLQNFLLMLHRCVTGERLIPSDIQYQKSKSSGAGGVSVANKDRQQTYLAERQLLYHVREGNLNYKQVLLRAASVSTGLGVTTDDPVRRAILSTTTFTSLCTRAAIEGGLSADTAYTVGDTYIQSMINCHSIAELSELNHRMYDDFILRVYRARSQPGRSKQIRDCCEYIQLHPEADLSIKSLARQYGYSDYYFSKQFRQEIGEGVTDYIDSVRMERAKMLLETTNTPVSEIAASMHYCSSTHFSNTFRQYVGMLPSQYRKQFR